MRKDISRINTNFNCRIIFQKKEIQGIVTSLSEGGLRISLNEYISMAGAIIDISVISNGKIILYLIGNVINQAEKEIGVSIFGIDSSSKKNIEMLLSNKVPLDLGKEISIFQKDCNILVLGAGGGKILAQLKMLIHLEEHIGKSILDYFKILVGVSSGGLILALLMKYRSLNKVEESLKKVSFSRILNFFPISSLLDITPLKKFLLNEFNNSIPNTNHILYLQYRNYNTGNYESVFYQNSNISLSEEILKSLSIPVIFGLTENYADGAVGFFINPSELFLRFARLRGLLDNRIISLLYLDAGLDPKFNEKHKTDILSQLFWTLRMGQRDSLLISSDRILNEFEKINYFNYFFTYSKNFDLFNFDDIHEAIKEVDLKKGDFLNWLQKLRI